MPLHRPGHGPHPQHDPHLLVLCQPSVCTTAWRLKWARCRTPLVRLYDQRKKTLAGSAWLYSTSGSMYRPRYLVLTFHNVILPKIHLEWWTAPQRAALPRALLRGRNYCAISLFWVANGSFLSGSQDLMDELVLEDLSCVPEWPLDLPREFSPSSIATFVLFRHTN